MTDTYKLNRFVEAQDKIYTDVVNELSHGQKLTHWMWFIFPQIEGLSHSPTAKKYAIKSKQEAFAYITHPVLGKRLYECSQLVLKIPGLTVNQIFCYPDDLKFHSCMTLFKNIANDNELFINVLHSYFNGLEDDLTLDILSGL